MAHYNLFLFCFRLPKPSDTPINTKVIEAYCKVTSIYIEHTEYVNFRNYCASKCFLGMYRNFLHPSDKFS